MGAKENDKPDGDALKERYAELKRLTANQIVAKGDGQVNGHALFNEIIKRSRAREKKAKDAASRKQARQRTEATEEAAAKRKLADNNGDETKLDIKELRALIKPHKKKGDKPIPTKKKDLIERFRQMKDRIQTASASAQSTSSTSVQTSVQELHPNPKTSQTVNPNKNSVQVMKTRQTMIPTSHLVMKAPMKMTLPTTKVTYR
jgi:hypothetical protein